MFTVIVRYTVQPGHEHEVQSILSKMVGPTRDEPGCVDYRVHRSLTDRSVFVLYEEYVDQAANEAHMETEYFKRHVLQEALPLLVSRVRETFERLE
jgi:quinol monooxygenase YgiN